MENLFCKIRTDLHQIPEIALEEYKTAKYIRNFLAELEIPFIEIGTSTLGIFHGNTDKWVGFRADIDALPINEEGDKSYKSLTPNMMHACGHDGHTTNLLVFAKWLKEQQNNGLVFKKSIMLIFQAGEEGKGGARFIADSDHFKSKNFDGIFALHVYPGIDEGFIATSKGPCTYQNINFDITITGKGCHGAEPHKGIDTILVGAKLIEAYQSIISRNVDPWEPAVLTIGSFKAGEVRNVIPEEAKLLGTIRIANRDLIPLFEKRLNDINTGLELAYGVKISMVAIPFYPPVINSENLYNKLKEIVPTEKFMDNIKLSGSEDFSFYLQEGNEGLLFLLGTKNIDKNHVYPLHTPKFDFDPKALETGFEIFKSLTYSMEVF